ncbi:unnamed protein product (macronuclear) [Paramecium tetraurelia]|uniref:Ubiquitin-like protease family profile domain-containing protein n=1 Tax=Paramecium tetraurelia TaxID=5888 RepID=A0CG81_PARTE|nr:uncharacterized protein GSPATT00038243001 [Paramecium tetraurelia]CAK69798.1 unnamed protein product [Paramecium tetraurelia]|eukprot:XP_001437195.1 hypothetical protein (macronuclear) [Paramecium tetraurelia strain d4-2]
MGNICVSDSDSLINEDSQINFNKIDSRPGINAVALPANKSLENIPIMPSPDSAYSITYMESMDVIQFTSHKFLILQKNSVYIGEINQKFQKNGKGNLYLQDVDNNGNQKFAVKKGMFINDKYQEPAQTSLFGACLDVPSDSEITEEQEQQKSIIQNNHQKYNKLINDKDLNSITDKNQLRANIVDGYIQYLQQLDEQLYWDTPPQKREKFQRTIIFQSTCSLEDSNQFQKKLLRQFGFVQFWLIYKKIGFVIEHDHNHWYFVKVSITEDKFIIYVYDSIKCSRPFYENIKHKLTKLFQILLNRKLQPNLVIKENIPQCYNNYDNAVYTCIFAIMFRSNCRNKLLKMSPLEMRSELRKLFLS